MKEPIGELLHLSFYLPEQSPNAALAALVEALLQNGADFSGIARGCKLDNQDKEYFMPEARIYRSEQLKVGNIQEFHSWLNSREVRVLEVLMKNASDTKRSECAVVTYGSISEMAAKRDVPSVSILSTGDLFSLARLPVSNSKKYANKAKKAGQKTYARLKTIVEAINPAYSSITIEWPLESPSDLKSDPRSLAFRDFYIKEAFVGTDQIGLIKSLFEGAYIEELGKGIYVSCTKEFNPKGVEVNKALSPWNTISTEVGKMIANTVPK